MLAWKARVHRDDQRTVRGKPETFAQRLRRSALVGVAHDDGIDLLPERGMSERLDRDDATELARLEAHGGEPREPRPRAGPSEEPCLTAG